MAKTAEAVAIGEGVYTFPEAARIVLRPGRPGRRVTHKQLRSWMAKGLTFGDHATESDYRVLSFSDLISLEVVTRFRQEGVTLQKVRRLERRLREMYPALERPFAHNVFFTDGASVWFSLNPDDPTDAIEVVGERPDHYVWRDSIKSFATEIRFDEDKRATSWQVSPWVELDPAVQFGAPVVAGTRIPVRTVVANLQAGSPADVADWYGLTVEQVEGVRAFANA